VCVFVCSFFSIRLTRCSLGAILRTLRSTHSHTHARTRHQKRHGRHRFLVFFSLSLSISTDSTLLLASSLISILTSGVVGVVVVANEPKGIARPGLTHCRKSHTIVNSYFRRLCVGPLLLIISTNVLKSPFQFSSTPFCFSSFFFCQRVCVCVSRMSAYID